MKTKRDRTIAIVLCVVWLMVMMFTSVWADNYLDANGRESQLALFSTYQFILMGIVCLVLLPLLISIHHYAKLAHMKIVVFCVRVLLAHHLFWLILLIIEMARVL